jgi:hypothetical protein
LMTPSPFTPFPHASSLLRLHLGFLDKIDQ